MSTCFSCLQANRLVKGITGRQHFFGADSNSPNKGGLQPALVDLCSANMQSLNTDNDIKRSTCRQIDPASTPCRHHGRNAFFSKGTPRQFFAPEFRIQSASLQGECWELKSPQQGVPVQSGTTYPSRKGSFAAIQPSVLHAKSRRINYATAPCLSLAGIRQDLS